jgi:cytochrome P450
MDIVVDLSCPLPVIVIARMLGVPAEDSASWVSGRMKCLVSLTR